MPIYFAAARSTAHSPIARALARRAIVRAANDNRDGNPASDIVLHAALRHFATHGLGAAIAALGEAERALAAGDRQSSDWWLGICRTLDRTIAERFQRTAEIRV